MSKKSPKKSNYSIGEVVKTQLGEMIIKDIMDDKVEVYKIQDSEKRLKSTIIIPLSDILDKKEVNTTYQKDEPKEDYTEFIEDSE